MKIKEIAALVEGETIGCRENEDYEMTKAFCSDLMSDVLRFSLEDTILLTGLCNIQTMRTAEMADLRVVLIGRGKQPDEEMLALAMESDITIIKTKFSLFKVCGILFDAGLKPLY